MTCTSLISKIHPDKPAYKKYFWANINGKPVEKHIVVQPLLCDLNEQLGILGKNDFVYKSGSFFTVINKKDEVFTLLENEIDFIGNIENKLRFVNKTPKFEESFESNQPKLLPEEFFLDLL